MAATYCPRNQKNQVIKRTIGLQGSAEKFIGWLRRSCATAMKLGMHQIKPILILTALFPSRSTHTG